MPAPRSFSAPSIAWEHQMTTEEWQCREYIDQLSGRFPQPSQPGQPSEPMPESEKSIIITSLGSGGHPEFCSRPCVYASKDACVNGSTCTFCHLPHSGAKMDKRQRTLLQEMSEEQMLDIMLAALKAKTRRYERKGINLPIESILAVLEEERNTREGFAATNSKELLNLQGILSKMSVAGMLGLANITRFRHVHKNWGGGVRGRVERRRKGGMEGDTFIWH